MLLQSFRILKGVVSIDPNEKTQSLLDGPRHRSTLDYYVASMHRMNKWWLRAGLPVTAARETRCNTIRILRSNTPFLPFLSLSLPGPTCRGLMTQTAYAGAFINPISLEITEFIPHGVCIVDDASGSIVEFVALSTEEEFAERIAHLPCVHRIPADSFFIPGLVDMHTHAPQYRNLGLGLDYELLEWLDKVTFPEERSYSQQKDESSEEHRNRVAATYNHMVRHYLRCGTTTCCYFGSLQMEANKMLVEQVALNGQRALIGKTCMDCNSPASYVESTEDSLQGTREFIDFVRAVDSKLPVTNTILPVVTPRFALTCTPTSMQALSAIAHQANVHVQTHMSENKGEIAFAAELFPECKNYAHVYGSVGLLGPKTFLAHCVHLDPAARQVLAQTDTAIAHCPTSNFALNSGVADVRAMIAAGIRVGLGSDVSGGYGLSMMDAMRQAIIASKARHFQDPSYAPLKVTEAFFLATLGGARALGLEERIGSFQPGKQFDALLVDMTACPVLRHTGESLHQCLQRFVFLGDDRWIASVRVNGASVI